MAALEAKRDMTRNDCTRIMFVGGPRSFGLTPPPRSPSTGFAGSSSRRNDEAGCVVESRLE